MLSSSPPDISGIRSIEQEWFTPNRECQDGGRGDGPETEGSGFFSHEPLAGADEDITLERASSGLMTTLPMARNTPVIVTHLASGTNGQSDRLRQLDALIPWAASRSGSGAKLLIGDFNSSPDTPEYQRVSAQFRDAWVDARRGGNRARPDGRDHAQELANRLHLLPVWRRARAS